MITVGGATYAHLLEALLALARRVADSHAKLQAAPDARHIGLSGIMRTVAGYAMGLRSMVHGQSLAEVGESLGVIESPSEDKFKIVEDAWRLGMATIVHFRVDSLLANLLAALGKHEEHNFYRRADAVLIAAGVTAKDLRLQTLMSLAHIRNSMHNNGMHRGRALSVTIHGLPFVFSPNSPVQCASWQHVITAIEGSIDELDVVLETPVIKALSVVRDDYYDAILAGQIQP